MRSNEERELGNYIPLLPPVELIAESLNKPLNIVLGTKRRLTSENQSEAMAAGLKEKPESTSKTIGLRGIWTLMIKKVITTR